MTSEFVYGSVCSGIEATSIAWKDLGWRCAFLSEIAEFPRALLKQRFSEVPLHGDFTTIEKGMYEQIDLLCGGVPCQSFSLAGDRRGMDDSRGLLALQFAKLASRLRPRWTFIENVPGLLSSNKGIDFSSILSSLAELGYGVCWRVLDAKDFGVPQRRKRLFIIGYLGDWRPSAAVLFESKSLCRYTPQSQETKPYANALTANGVGAGGGPDDNSAQGNHLIAFSAKGISSEPDSVRRLTVIETERLQGLPDNWTQVSFHGKPAADSHRYKAVGNSMAVPVISWLGKRIAFVNSKLSLC